MKLTIGTKIFAGYFLAIIILVFIGLTSYFNSSGLLADSKRVTKSNSNKNDISAVLLELQNAETGQRGYLITGNERYLDIYFQGRDSVYNKLNILIENITDKNQIQNVKKLKPLIDSRLARMDEVIQIYKNKGFAAVGNNEIMSSGKKIMDDLRAILAEMTLVENKLLVIRNAGMESATMRTNSTIFWGMPIALIILALVGFFITRNIAKPLSDLAKRAELISGGDLSGIINPVVRNDEVGVLMRSFNNMVEVLKTQNQEILKGVNVITSTSAQILTSTTQIGTGSAETASAISETTTTVEEVRQAAVLSSEKAKNLSDTASRVVQVSLDGRKAVDETFEEMTKISKQMDEIAQTVILLSEQSQAIGGIIASVTDLASQSNLLAVNAAIEAAKAGEQGKGFSVVAQEIRNLAEQSKQATLQVRKILNDIQKATSAAVLATEQGNRAVEAGVKKSVQAGEAIRTLSETSGTVFQVTTQIVVSNQQQLIGMDQIGMAMQNINQAGLDTAVSMNQTEEALKNLQDLGQILKEQVEQFRM
jgi:methyl-accepting chemotaxis protein